MKPRKKPSNILFSVALVGSFCIGANSCQKSPYRGNESHTEVKAIFPEVALLILSGAAAAASGGRSILDMGLSHLRTNTIIFNDLFREVDRNIYANLLELSVRNYAIQYEQVLESLKTKYKNCYILPNDFCNDYDSEVKHSIDELTTIISDINSDHFNEYKSYVLFLSTLISSSLNALYFHMEEKADEEDKPTYLCRRAQSIWDINSYYKALQMSVESNPNVDKEEFFTKLFGYDSLGEISDDLENNEKLLDEIKNSERLNSDGFHCDL